MNFSVLQQIQNNIADRLAADPFFENIPIITEQKLDIQNEVDIAIGSIGICVVIVTPIANILYPDRKPPYFDFIGIVARVIENVVVNQSSAGTQIRAMQVAEQLVLDLSQFQPDGVNEVVVADNPTIVLGNDPANLSYDVLFKTQGGITDTIPQVAAPTHSASGGVTTISTVTAGASIWYTTDGKAPYPRSPTGHLYTAPVAITSGATVRARAGLWGYLNSAETKWTV